MPNERADLPKRQWWSTALRALAVTIAVAAAIDPAVTTNRRSRALISLVAAEPQRDSAMLRQARNVLRQRFTVIEAPLTSASGSVLVGSRPPRGAATLGVPVVVLTPARDDEQLEIVRVAAPSRAVLPSRVTVNVGLAVRGMASGALGRDVTVELAVRSSPDSAQRADERAGDALVVSRERVRVQRDSVVFAALTFVPPKAEPSVLQVRATIAGSADTARSDLAIDVRATKWSVLFFDRRPSWMSTFVRRAIERDPRFEVTSRIITSTNISRTTGQAPPGLDAIAASSRFDAVVIGAPDALTAPDVRGIELLLRARGASVLVLADNAGAGQADRLLGFGGWRSARPQAAVAAAPFTLQQASPSGRDPIRLMGREVGVPLRLPSNAQPIAQIARDTGAATQGRAIQTVIWRTPVGKGSLIVSGAFDSWRYRDNAQSTFDATWRDLVERAASERQPALDMQLSRTLVEPRERVSVAAAASTLQSLATPQEPIRITVSAATRGIQSDSTGDPAHQAQMVIEADDSFAASRASFRAPPRAGTYQVLATRGTDSVSTTLVVTNNVARDAEADRGLLEAWVRSQGGRRIARSAVGSLNDVLDSLITNPSRMTTWHPMRSAWWILPFAVALAGEWWLRRRRGLP